MDTRAQDTKSVALEGDPLRAIALKIASVCAFMAMSACIKLSGPIPSGQIVFFRSFFAIVPILIFLALTHQLKGVWHTKHPVSHLIRGLVGVAGMAFGFFALVRLPLPDAVALGYASPLVTVVLGALILGETVRRFRWTAVAVGFIGVMIISWPKLQVLREPSGIESAQALGVLSALAAAAIAGVAFILVRRLVKTERTSTIVLYFSITASVMALFSIPFGWHALTLSQTALLVASGIFGGIGQVTLTQAYRYAETSIIAPFEYSSVLLSLGIGYWLFAEVPTLATLIGSAIVVAAGISIILREGHLGLKRSSRKVVTPQG